ncbi:hypothetical protein ACQ4LE_009588 [Meloidogyne hapla]
MAKFFLILVIFTFVFIQACYCGKPSKNTSKKAESVGDITEGLLRLNAVGGVHKNSRNIKVPVVLKSLNVEGLNSYLDKVDVPAIQKWNPTDDVIQKLNRIDLTKKNVNQ